MSEISKIKLPGDTEVRVIKDTTARANAASAASAASEAKTIADSKSVVSGTGDDTNWGTITINGTTKNIPVGGGGEPTQYLKTAELETAGSTKSNNQLKITNKDNTTVVYNPDFSKVSVASTGTATDEVSYITIDGVEKKLAGGGSGEPAAYLKSASSSGNTLTLVNKDDSTVAYTPDLSSKQDVISDLSDIREGASKGETAYQKPATGIPSSDMSSAVQTSLGKADTALQEHQSLADYSTTAEMNSAISAHHDSSKQDVISDLADIRSGASAGATAYQKPATGIPSTDLASAVQTSLGKADTALQTHQSLADYSTTVQMNDAISAHHDSSKQDTISDLATIRSGAASGATALQSSALDAYRTSADQDTIDNTKADKTSTVSNVSYDSTNRKIQQTINGTTSDVVTINTISGTGSASVWGTLTIDGVTKNLPSGGGGEPTEYLKSATIETAGSTKTNNQLTLKDKDNNSIVYNPDFSKVGVSATGTATDEISYITVDGIEKKIASGSSYTAGDGIDISSDTISTKLGNGLKYTDSDKKITIKPADKSISVGEFGVRVPIISTSLEILDTGVQVKLADDSIEAYNSGTGTKGLRVKPDKFQNKLTAGTNITISGDTISATDTTYTEATTSVAGLMSSADKTKLDGIASGAEVNVQSDWTETDTTSDAYIKNKPTLATVATSGSYNDLSNKPSIPTKTSDLTNDSGFIDNTYHDSSKQDVLTAGSNINISGNTISATDTTYTAGTGLSLSGNQFSIDNSVVQGKLTAGTGSKISIDSDNNISTNTSVVSVSATGTATDAVSYLTIDDTEYKIAGGAGSVTSVAVTGGSDLTVTGSPITTSGTINITHSNSITAASDVAIYPIRYDSNGHIVSAQSALTATPAELNYVHGVTSAIQTQLDGKSTVTLVRW